MRLVCSLANHDLQKQRVINNLKRPEATAQFSATLTIETHVKGEHIIHMPKIMFESNGDDEHLELLFEGLFHYIGQVLDGNDVES